MPILRWLTRDEDVRAAEKVPYRLMEEEPELGYGDQNSGNMLIQGDNLDALKALLPYYAGQVKCIYIDPPYNTGSAFEHYDDNLEHSKWLAMMWCRLELLRELLAEDGSIWISIDEDEHAYLKVICDEVFGRRKFVTTNVWQKRYAPDSRVAISDAHEYVLCYAMEPRSFKETRNLIPLGDAQTKQFKNPDKDPRGPWKADNFTAPGHRPNQMYEITLPSGRVVTPPGGRCWRVTREGFERFRKNEQMYYGPNGDGAPSVKRFLAEMPGMVPWTWWPHTDVGHYQEGKKENQAIFGHDDTFGTPKPERLIERILQIATNPDDLVLDSFLGSGTTAAVAQKMDRRYIGIEMGEHAVTHCVPRLKKVVDGEQGGISEAQNWQGGGGFRFYRLGPPVFTKDGQIQPDIKFPVLAAHIWFTETGTSWSKQNDQTPFLGSHNGHGYALLYNGILGDKAAANGNVLTRKMLAVIRAAQGDFEGPMTIYGERTMLSEATLDAEQIEFKQTPYDVKART
ncbi:site-specific DNA-methyltransferase [Vreelandella venusta]|uniref:site-specific DNA-methyltransferase n=1 Tax=Vreelandella venusta TaxID=44935 RepID=UPI00384FF61D